MDLTIIALIAAPAWIFVAVIVLAMCKAASRADATAELMHGTLLAQRESYAPTPERLIRRA